MKSTIIPFIAAIILTGVSLVGAILWPNLIVPFILLLLFSWIVFIWMVKRRRLVILNEMEIGVIFNRRTNNFIRFIVTPNPNPTNPVSQRPSRFKQLFWPFLDIFSRHNPIELGPYHYILRPEEELRSTLPKGSQTTAGTASNLRTKDGILLDIDYVVSFTLDISRILPTIQHKMARALPTSAVNMVSGRVVQALKHIIETKSINELYLAANAANPPNGSLIRLETELQTIINGKLVNLGFSDIPLKDIKLGPITMPPQVESALKATHQRELQTATLTKSLNELHQAISNFTKEDMQRLNDLERLRILDTRATWVNMSDYVVNKNKNVVTQQPGGSSGSGGQGNSPTPGPNRSPNPATN